MEIMTLEDKANFILDVLGNRLSDQRAEYEDTTIRIINDTRIGTTIRYKNQGAENHLNDLYKRAQSILEKRV